MGQKQPLRRWLACLDEHPRRLAHFDDYRPGHGGGRTSPTSRADRHHAASQPARSFARKSRDAPFRRDKLCSHTSEAIRAWPKSPGVQKTLRS